MNLIFKQNSIKNLSFGKKNISGRNNEGRITIYHRGGGCKKKLRIIDYNRYIWNLLGYVKRIEYDPNRNSLIALIIYPNGILSYIIATEGLRVGSSIISKDSINLNSGNCSYLSSLPVSLKISCLEIYPNSGAQLARAAGSFAIIISKSKNYCLLKLKSGEIRKFHSNCIATIGVVSNFSYIYKNFKKAGYYRLKGWRPVVRGVAMNPVDHPHGGGQGKTSGGRPSVTPYGFITKGKPTRSKKKSFWLVKKRNK